MVKIFAIILLCLSFTANAVNGVKTEKPIVCFPTKVFLKEIKEKYNEEPMIVGKTTGVTNVATIFYINRDNGTFTVVEIDEEAACVISVGTEVKYRFPKIGTTT